VKRVAADADGVSLVTEDGHSVSASKVILCTNGFETLHIDNHAGKPIDASFHYEVRGAIGFMVAYLIEGEYAPRMRAYEGVWNFKGHPVYGADGGEVLEEPYVYISIRPFGGKTLVSIGGPEDFVEDTTVYTPGEYVFPDSALTIIQDFLKNYAIPLPEKPDYMWHGLMGYTRSGLRLIGPEPKNPNVLYNLGCNGIGLLPSFLGAERIARLLNGEKLTKSVFDPKG
jgi:glycine/D-amino acid oxidase-like deaminating enzyme